MVVAADQFLPTYWAGLVLAPLVMGGMGWLVTGHHPPSYRKPLDTLLASGA